MVRTWARMAAMACVSLAGLLGLAVGDTSATAAAATAATAAANAANAPNPASPARVASVSPQGEVAQVRQVVVRFSEAVVALGDLRLADPMVVTCVGGLASGKQGSGRWADAKTWLYDFSEPLPPATRCTVKARSDWQPLQGPLVGTTQFSFSTGGPAVVRTWPFEGSTVEEDQHFLLQLSGPVVPASVLSHAWCEVEGIGERIAVRIVNGAVREDLIKRRKLERLADRLLLLTCQRPLPSDTALRLVWGAGIVAQLNPQLNPQITTRGAQRLEFQVRKPFRAEFSCERERANAPCLPIRPLSLSFSEPISRSAAQQVKLRPLAASGGATASATASAVLSPVFDKDDLSTEVSVLRFAHPLPENSSFVIQLPPDLKDAAGRVLSNAASFPLTVRTGEAPPMAKFAAAPFGVIERDAQPMLPVTLRRVQSDLRPAAAGGQVRIFRVESAAQILSWFDKLQRFHESRVTAKEAGWPAAQWTTVEVDTDARGRSVRRQVDRLVAAREVSLLKTESGARRLDLPQLQGGDPRPFEVVGIPINEPGYHVVEIESQRLGAALLDKTAPMFVRTGVLVTNLGLHFKHGRESSLAWVTTLDRGKPVAGAEIKVHDCKGKMLWSGITDASGLAPIAQVLDPDERNCVVDQGLFITARTVAANAPKSADKGPADMAFVFSRWQQGIESWRFDMPTAQGAVPDVQAHTVFDRTLLRAGETVSMKHFIRAQTLQGLASLGADALPNRLKIVHEGSGQEYSQDVSWQGVRSATSTWNIPPAARLGLYRVVLERQVQRSSERDQERAGTQAVNQAANQAVNQAATPTEAPTAPPRQWTSGDFRVEEFRSPLVDARLVPPKPAQVAPQSLALGVQMNYFSGGPMAQAPLAATALLRPRNLYFADHPGFSFEPPRELQAEAAQQAPEPDESNPDQGRLIADKQPLRTDANGAAQLLLSALPKISRPSEVTAEISFNDPNGEVQTVAATVPLWPSAVVLGVKTEGWASSRGQMKFSVLALDTAGKPLKGQQVAVRGRLVQVISTRKRMVGGFYAYDNRTQTQDLGQLCSGSTDARGLLLCDATLQTAGQVELIAQAKDGAGNAAQAAASVWITRQGELWFAQDNDDRMDVLAEKKSYQPGETARLQVRMPFREATALVAVEREGVIATRVLTLRGNDPTVELKIEPGWGPNVYVSVLAVRGRIRDVPWYSFFSWGWKEPLNWARSFWIEGREYQAPTAMVDLSKPAFKLGVVALKVGTAAHALQVQVVADKPQYMIRDKALVRISVTQGGKPAAGAELAFAAVDESLLALRENSSWDLLNAMFSERAWGVQTSTAHSEIIGRRHYGRKAVPAGGGGGRGGTRELFDTLLLWQPRLQLDAKGQVTLEVPLNDSLSSFRLVAIADEGVQNFGTGSVSIRVSQDLQILAGLPPLVREGDRFQALLTLRNTTARAMKLRATLAGTVNTGQGAAITRSPLVLPPQELQLAAGSAQEISWAVEVPQQAFSIEWEAAVQDLEQSATQDRLKVTQLVKEAVPVRVLQATLQPLDAVLSIPVEAPVGALSVLSASPASPASSASPVSAASAQQAPKRGGLQVAVQPSLGGALPGLQRYFQNYPYTCLEQRASKAIGLRDATLWAEVVNSLPTYLDSDGLASFFPPSAGEGPRGSDRLTAYLLAAAHESGFALPPALQESMLQGLAAFAQGRIERRFWSPRPDLEVRKLAAIEALSRYGRAQPQMLSSINLRPQQWPTAAVIDWLQILQRVQGLPGQTQRLDEAQQILRARINVTGTRLSFNNEQDDFWWWLMDSPDANAARLILAVLELPAWRDDLPRMVVGTLGRQKQGAWLTTTANLWGSLALQKFSQRFEAVPPSGRTLISTAGVARSIDWAQSPAGGQMLLPWPAGAGTLEVRQEGAGKPWLTLQSLAAVELKAPIRAGYSLQRSISAVQRKDPQRWSRGDIVRVRLEIDAQADMSWVVVNDPVPAGAAILGSGLGRDSVIATRGEQRQGRAWPAFEERSFEAYRSYFEFMPSGKHVLEYSLRLNNPGRFLLPPSRVEALYAPDSFGETPNTPLEVAP